MDNQNSRLHTSSSLEHNLFSSSSILRAAFPSFQEESIKHH